MNILDGGKRPMTLASKLTLNFRAPQNMPPRTKHDPANVEPGGYAVVAAPVLQLLGERVVLMGRCTPALTPFMRRSAGAGIICRMLKVEGPEPANLLLDGDRIVRVAPGPKCLPTKEDGEILCDIKPCAIALGGSMDNDYAGFLAEYAAATGIPLFWNPSASADLHVADVGARFVLQVSFSEFANGESSTAALARRLLAQTAATVVVVTDGERGAYAVAREAPHSVLHAPAVPIADPVREVGAGDAHSAAFAAMYLAAPKAVRLARSLEAAALVAARHIIGLNPGGWQELARFRASLDRVPEVREVA
jgi:sugar/nucleoside kinase (ribokinase family)